MADALIHYTTMAIASGLMLLSFAAIVGVLFETVALTVYWLARIISRQRLRLEGLLVISPIYNAVEIIFYIGIGCLALFLDASDLKWIGFWNQPAVLAVLLTILVINSRQAQAYHMVAQNSGNVGLFAIPIALTVVVSQIFPHLFSIEAARWFMVAGAALITSSSLLALRIYKKKVIMFQYLDERHNELGRQIKRLQRQLCT